VADKRLAGSLRHYKDPVDRIGGHAMAVRRLFPQSGLHSAAAHAKRQIRPLASLFIHDSRSYPGKPTR
jgi:hypothetical protein